MLLTHFTQDTSSVVTVPLKLRWDVPADLPRNQARGPRFAQTELLATPAEFIVADGNFGGFWLLPEEELEKRLKAAGPSTGTPPANVTPAPSR